MLNLPATDFTLLLYILPEKLQTDVRKPLSHPLPYPPPLPIVSPLLPSTLQETILTIKDAAEALETARYANFWSILNSRGPVFTAIPQWKEEIRKSTCVTPTHLTLSVCSRLFLHQTTPPYTVILNVHAATYQSVAKEEVAAGVGLTGSELDAFLQGSKGVVASVEADRVVFAANKENQLRVRKFKEKVDLQNMLGILNRLAA